MAFTMLWSVVTCAALVPSAFAFPGLYLSVHQGCTGPTQRYKGHGAPMPTDATTFALTDAAGASVTTWMPETAYILTVSNPAAVNAWVHTTTGVFSNEVDATGKPVTAAACPGLAWHSTASATSHAMNWMAPACCTEESVTVQATVASGSSAAYQQTEVTLPGDVSACTCTGTGTTPTGATPTGTTPTGTTDTPASAPVVAGAHSVSGSLLAAACALLALAVV